MKKAKGFTLIELMVTIVIVAILASIAIPSYREYIIRGNRRAAQAAMMEVATRQQQYYVANRIYAASIEDLGYTLPEAVQGKYTAALVFNAGPPPSFDITFTAAGTQVSDGDLTLDSEGNKGPEGKWHK